MQLLKLFHIIDANPEYLWVIFVKKWWGSNWHFYTYCLMWLLSSTFHCKLYFAKHHTENLPPSFSAWVTFQVTWCHQQVVRPLSSPSRGEYHLHLAPFQLQRKLKTPKYIFETMMLKQAFDPKQWCFCSVFIAYLS